MLRMMLPAVLVVCCSACAVRAQDVAPPEMPEVDLKAEEAGKREEERREIRRFIALLRVVCLLSVEEETLQGGPVLLKDCYKRVKADFPEQALRKCPLKFQKLIQLNIKEMQDFMDGRTQDLDWPFSQDRELSRLLVQYDMMQEDKLINEWVGKRVFMRKMADDVRPSVMDIRQLKSDIESGKIEVSQQLEEEEEE